MNTPIPNIISWPLSGIDEEGNLAYSQREQSVREVILNILLTRPGERLMRPEFGAGLLNFIHQPNNETTRNLIAGVIRKAINQWEPRVEVEEVQVLADNRNLAEVHITIRFHMRYVTTPMEFSLSLNLEQLV